MSTHRTCCCGCGDSPCIGTEYRYESTAGSNCPICAVGRTEAKGGGDRFIRVGEPEGQSGSSGNYVIDNYVRYAPMTELDNWYNAPHPNNLYYGDICLDAWRPLPDDYLPGQSRGSARPQGCPNPPHCGDYGDMIVGRDYAWWITIGRQNWSSGYYYDELSDCPQWDDCYRYHPFVHSHFGQQFAWGGDWWPDCPYGPEQCFESGEEYSWLGGLARGGLQACSPDTDYRWDDIFYGFSRPEGGCSIRSERDWEDCESTWGSQDAELSEWSISNPIYYPSAIYYQFNPPWGYLPWSPQVMNDWMENWEGPLKPQGDCTMHCTPDNIGCHKLAFVGGLGNAWENAGYMAADPEGDLVGDPTDNMPLCGSDVLTIPPLRGENDEGWLWVREWVQSGGKLVVLAETIDTQIGNPCRYKWGDDTGRWQAEGLPGGWATLSYPPSSAAVKILDPPYSCMHDDWWDVFKNPDQPDEENYQFREDYGPVEIEQQLREFAFFCADDGSTDPEFYYICRTEDEDVFDEGGGECSETGTETGINKIEWDPAGYEGLNYNQYDPKMCCQKTKSPFKKLDDGEEGLPASFAMNTSNAAGLVPISENGGKKLVGSCDSRACTAVYKQNGLGAVIVIYDSTVFGGKATQIPIEWYEAAAKHPENQALVPPLTAEELKLMDCNNDFWKFLCEEFISTDNTSGCNQDEPIFWEEFLKPYDQNECALPVMTAACCLPDGSCENLDPWSCFKEKGVWRGHPSANWGSSVYRNGNTNNGLYNVDAQTGEQRWCEGSCNPTCEQLNAPCHPLPKGTCCKKMYKEYDLCDWDGNSLGESVHLPTGYSDEGVENPYDVYEFECGCQNHGKDFAFWGPDGQQSPTFETGFLEWGNLGCLGAEGECTTHEPYSDRCSTDSDCPGEGSCCKETTGGYWTGYEADEYVAICEKFKTCQSCQDDSGCTSDDDCVFQYGCCHPPSGNCIACDPGEGCDCVYSQDCEEGCECVDCECECPGDEDCCIEDTCEEGFECDEETCSCYEVIDCCNPDFPCSEGETCDPNCECVPAEPCDCGGYEPDCDDPPPSQCTSDEDCIDGSCCREEESDFCEEYPDCECPKSCQGCPCTSTDECAVDRCCVDGYCETCPQEFICCNEIRQDCYHFCMTQEYCLYNPCEEMCQEACGESICANCIVTEPNTICYCQYFGYWEDGEEVSPGECLCLDE